MFTSLKNSLISAYNWTKAKVLAGWNYVTSFFGTKEETTAAEEAAVTTEPVVETTEEVKEEVKAPFTKIVANHLCKQIDKEANKEEIYAFMEVMFSEVSNSRKLLRALNKLQTETKTTCHLDAIKATMANS